MPIAVPVRPPRPPKPLALSLKQRKTAAISAPTLPNASLAFIFRTATLVPPAVSSIDPSFQATQSRATILSLSHVNSQWRSISLTIPELWHRLLLFDLDSDVNEVERPIYARKPWLKELFRRSDPLPIDIGIAGYSYLPRDPVLVGLELEHLHRIRTYRALLDERGWETLSSCLDEPAAVLQSLSLAFRPAMGRTSAFDQAPTPQLPRDLFNGHCPRLTKISLRGCLPSQSDFSSAVRANLTSLTVSQVSGPGVPTADRWLAHLSGMRRLEHLLLEGGAIAGSSRPQKRNSQPRVASSEAVVLPSLRSLLLEGDVEAIGTLLHRLQPSVDARISASCSGVRREGGIDHVLSTFGERMENAAMGIGAGPTVSFLAIKGGESKLEVSDGTHSHHLSLSFCREDTQAPTPTPTWETVLSKFLGTVPFTIASLMAMEIQLPSAPPSLIRSLSGACQLERLVNLNTTMLRQMLPPLQKYQMTMGMGSPSSPALPHRSLLSPLPVLPALHTLHACSSDVFSGSSWAALQGYLRWRALGWRAVRVIQVPMAGGIEDEVVDVMRKLNISFIYVE
ncbi:hypothetical protein DFP72DRAFT_469186 [Ephemerocybe angulata]|uniref:F-box domain-containing protein n=1 Tax=Ephemerocybe angulata TaxID=980116 RepID=A0A8H6HT64_9AGAR|nr:hypothetical protein DFP72DRAFT_469186 [Tulosesus angulatus]